MASLTVGNYLGMLQEDPEAKDALDGLAALLGDGESSAASGTVPAPDETVRLLEAARSAHEQRGEFLAAAHLLELEANLHRAEPDFEATLRMELGRIYAEELLNDEAAKTAYARVLELRPNDPEVEDLLEQMAQAADNWRKLSKRFVDEAQEASDATLKTSMLVRAASLVWQHKKRGREKETDALFEQALAADPSSTRAARLFAETLRQRERFSDVVRVLHAAAEHARSRDEKLVLYMRTARVALARTGQGDVAKECYRRALDFDPSNEEALRYLVGAYTESESWDELVALYEEALRSRQKLESEQGILLQLGMVHWRIRSEAEQAEPYFARLRKIDPAHPGMLEFYRAHLAGDEDPHRLLTILGDAQRTTKEEGLKRTLAAEIAQVAERDESTTERAIDAWKSVQRLSPEDPEPRAHLRTLYAKAEKWNALVELLKYELERLGEDARGEKIALLREMVGIYRDHLHLDVMVINTFNAILELAPDDEEALRALSETYEGMGRWNDLIQVLSRQADATEDAAHKVDLLSKVASLWIERFANYNQATKPLEQIVEIEPEHRGALASLKEIYGKKRAWAALFDVLQKEVALASDPEARNTLRVEMATLAGERMHRHSDAIAIWRDVLEEAPATGTALDALEKLSEREKDWATLAYVLEKRVEGAETDEARIKLLQRLGTVCGEHLGEPARAAEVWQRVLELDPRNGRAVRTLRESFLAAQDWQSLEALYAETNDWEGLVDVLGTAAERTTDPDLKVTLSFKAAAIYEGPIGEPHRAFRNYERVLTVQPSNTQAAEKLIPIYERDEKWGRLVNLKAMLLAELPEDADVADKLELLSSLREVSLERLSDEDGAYLYAVEAYQIAPTDDDVVANLEAAAEAAKAHEALAQAYLARLGTGDLGADEELRLRRRVAQIAGEHLGQTEKAIEQLENVLRVDPTDMATMDVLDGMYRADGKTDALRALFLKRIEITDDPDRRFGLLGELAILEEGPVGDPESARGRYEAMRELRPDDEVVLRALDRHYTEGELFPALAEVVEARLNHASSDQQRLPFMLRLADLCLNHLGQGERALRLYADVLALFPGTEEAVAGVERIEKSDKSLALEAGRLLEEAYASREADEKLRGVLERRLTQSEDEHEQRDLRIRLAELCVSKGAHKDAFAFLQAALRAQPTDVDLWERLRAVAEQAQLLPQLAEAFAEVLDADALSTTDRVDLAGRIAQIYDVELAETEKAEPFHRRVLVEEPLHERSFDALKELYTTFERWDDLQVLYRNRIAETVDADQKLELLLQVCFLFEELLDDAEQAIRAYQDVLELEPTHAASRRALDRLYRRTERYRDLAGLLHQELTEAEGQEALETTFELGEIYEEKLEDAAAAVGHYEAVLTEQPTHLRAQEALERLISTPSQRQRVASILEPLYESQGAYGELVVVLEVQLEELNEPGARVAHLLRVAELREHKLHEIDKAFKALSEAVLVDPSDVRAREELARVAKACDEERARAELLAKALESVTEPYLTGELLLELASLWSEHLGDDGMAKPVYERLLNVDPDNPETVMIASRALERIHLAEGDYAALVENLRRQVKFEHDPDVRGELLLRLATLLEDQLEDVDAAILAHRERLEHDATDLDALGALERLFSQKEEWLELIGVLQSREQVVADEAEQKRIAKRMAEVYETRLEDADSAIVAYNDLLSRFGPEDDTLDALARLYRASEKWEDLLEITQMRYDQSGDPVVRSELRFEAGELMRTRTNDLEGAIEAYAEVLGAVPEHQKTVDALEALMAAGAGYASLAAARVLAPRYEASQHYESLLRVFDALCQTEDPIERLTCLKRAAEVADVGLDDGARAFDLHARAVRAALSEPELEQLLREQERLASVSDRFGDYVALLRDVAPDIMDGDLQADTLLRIAELAQERLEDDDLAIEYYRKLLQERPEHAVALSALEHLFQKRHDYPSLIEILQRKTEVAEESARLELLLRQADIFENNLEDLPSAIDCAEDVLNSSDRPEPYGILERLYPKVERFDELASLYDRQLDAGAGDSAVELRYRLGCVLVDKLGDTYRALDCFRYALMQDASHDPTVARLEALMEDEEHRAVAAEILEPVFLSRMDWGKVSQALEARVSAETDPAERKALFGRMGDLYEDYLEDLDGALEAYARLFREDIYDQEVWDKLGRLARNSERFDRLAEVYGTEVEQAGVSDDTTARLAFMTGQLHDQYTGDLIKASQFYEEALRFEPTDAAVFAALENVLRRREAHPELLALYREQTDIAPSDSERVSLLHKAGALLRGPLADGPAAIDTYRELLDIDGHDVEAVGALDRLLETQERWSELVDHVRTQVELGVGDPAEQRHRMGVLLLEKLHDTEGALDAFEEVLEAGPHAPTIAVLESLVQNEANRLRITEVLEPVYKAQDQWKKLVAVLEAQVSMLEDPVERGAKLAEIGSLHEQRGQDLRLAMYGWGRAFIGEPSDTQYREQVERLADEQEAWNELVNIYEDAIKGSDDPAVIGDLLGAIARVHDEYRGDPRQAITTYERLAAHETEDMSPLDALEALHTMVGDWRGMVDVLNRRVERSFDPDDRGESLRRAGSVLEELLQDRDGAIDAYRRATEENDADLVAFESLDRLYSQASDFDALAEVLARRVDIEEAADDRVAIGVRLGQLLDTQLSRPHEAIDAFQRVLNDDAEQREAVEGLSRLYERQAMWPEFIENLRLRVALAETTDERVFLTHRVGQVLEREMDDVHEALTVYSEVLSLDDRHEHSIEALIRISQLEDYREQAAEVLDPLLTAQSRWDDLAELLGKKLQSTVDNVERRDLFSRLSEIHREGRGDIAAAFDALVSALAEDPADESLADRLTEVAGEAKCFDKLADAFSERAGAVFDPQVARGLFERLAKVAEHELQDDGRAIDAFSRALEQVGDEEALLAELDRLLVKVDDKARLGDVLERRVQTTMDPEGRAALLLRLGEHKFTHQKDSRGALAAYQEILEETPSRADAQTAMRTLFDDGEVVLEALESLDNALRSVGDLEQVAELYEVRLTNIEAEGERVRLLQELAALREQDLSQPALAFDALKRAFELDPRDLGMLDELERLAGGIGSYEGLRGLVERVSSSDDVDRGVVLELYARAARWYRDLLGDLKAAEATLRRALTVDEEFRDAHEQLVELLKGQDDRGADVVTALRAWAAADGDDFNKRTLLQDAALRAEQLGDTQAAVDCHQSVLAVDAGDVDSLDALLRLRRSAERHEDVAGLLERRIEVEMDPATRLVLRRELADLFAGPLGDDDRAMAALETLLDEEPSDLSTIAALENIYDRKGRYEDVQGLIERRLDLADTDEDRIAARVRLARLNEERFGRTDEAMTQLREILEIDPHHPAALDELERLLVSTAQWGELIPLLEQRLDDAVQHGDNERQVLTLSRLASICRDEQGDPDGAVSFFERALEVDPQNVEALTAVLAIHEAQGRHGEVCHCLERLAAVQPAEEAVASALRLADIAKGELGDPDQAERALRLALDLAPTDDNVRGRLTAHLESEGNFAALAELMMAQYDKLSEVKAKVELLKQVAAVYAEKLDDAGRAAAMFERAAELVPDDREVLLPLCDFYIAADRSHDAIPVLRKIIESYGARRAKEVAQYHHRLGRALEQMGDLEGAKSAYESAFQIDLTNVAILRDLGRLRHQQGDFEQAQKTFRALLLQKLDDKAGITKADVYFYLGDISAKQGDKLKAVSMLERAVAEDKAHERATALLSDLKG